MSLFRVISGLSCTQWRLSKELQVSVEEIKELFLYASEMVKIVKKQVTLGMPNNPKFPYK